MPERSKRTSSPSAEQGPGPRQIRVSHPDELAGLSVYPWRRSRSRGRVHLADASLDRETRGEWEKRLNRAIAACGCGEASLGLLTGALIGGGWLAWRWLDSGASTISWTLPVIAALVGSFAGKAAGLMRAQGKLKRLTRTIRRDWKAKPRVYAKSDCG